VLILKKYTKGNYGEINNSEKEEKLVINLEEESKIQDLFEQKDSIN
jgi:hypothetical protein